MTRQRRYQLRKRAEGRCLICARPADASIPGYCRFHHAYQVERSRRRRAAIRSGFDLTGGSTPLEWA